MRALIYRLQDRGITAIHLGAAGATLGVAVLSVATLWLSSAPDTPPEAAAPAPVDLPFVATDNTFERGCQLGLLVEDAAGPLADAQVGLYRVGRSASLQHWQAVTSRHGTHRFIDLPPGTYHVEASAPGHAHLAPANFTCTGDEERGFVAVTLPAATHQLSGRVTGFEGRIPDGLEVMIEQAPTRKTAFAGVLHATVDHTGSFVLPVPAGEYTVLATAPHHVPETQTITVEDNAPSATVRFSLAHRPEATGIVRTATGKRVPFAEVFLGPNPNPLMPPVSVTTDEDGAFSIPVVPGQAHTLTARRTGYIGSLDIPATQGIAGPSDLEIVAAVGHKVAGFVRDMEGQVRAFEPVRYRVRDTGLTGVVKTDDQGRFIVRGLPRADVELWPEDGASGAWAGAVATLDAPVVRLTYQKPAY